jgi:hypothetical protein
LEHKIKATAEEIIGEKNYKKNEEWFNEESATYIREKNKARQKMLQMRQDLITRSIKNGDGRLKEYVQERRERI